VVNIFHSAFLLVFLHMVDMIEQRLIPSSEGSFGLKSPERQIAPLNEGFVYLEQLQYDLLTGAAGQQLTQSIQHNLPCGLAHARGNVLVHLLLATHCTSHTHTHIVM